MEPNHRPSLGFGYPKGNRENVRCKHCHHEVPKQNYLVHEVRCQMMNQSRMSQRRESERKEGRSSQIPVFNPPNHQPKREYEGSSVRYIQSEVRPKPVEVEETIPCSYCGYAQTFAELDTHPGQCPGREEQCPDCKVGVPTGLMDDHRYVCEARRSSRSSHNSGMNYSDFDLDEDEEDHDTFSNIHRFMLERAEREQAMRQQFQERRRHQQGIRRQGFESPGMGGMMIFETRDPNGNVLRRAVPSHHVFGPNFGERRGNPFGDFFNLLSLMAQRHREQEQDRGLTKEEIRDLPRVAYHCEGQKDLCTICYCEFQEQEKVISLRCKHLYHEQCIVKWLQRNATCPVCKRPQTDRRIQDNEDE